MNGFLGTEASFLSDISLVSTILLGLVAAFGGKQAKRKKFSTHCPVMTTAAMLNWLPVLVVMIPSWLGVVQGTEQLASGLFANVPVFHGILGGFTQLLMTYTVTRMYWIESLPPQKPIWLMRTTIFLWILTVLGGIGVYLVSFVI
jgi:uncharacterized membrane protein YozB (DUF420 family)